MWRSWGSRALFRSLSYHGYYSFSSLCFFFSLSLFLPLPPFSLPFSVFPWSCLHLPSSQSPFVSASVPPSRSQTLSLCRTLFLLIPGSARNEKVKLWGYRHVAAQVAWQGAWCMVTLFLTRVRGDSGDKVSDQQPDFHPKLPGGMHSKGPDTEALRTF